MERKKGKNGKELSKRFRKGKVEKEWGNKRKEVRKRKKEKERSGN